MVKLNKSQMCRLRSLQLTKYGTGQSALCLRQFLRVHTSRQHPPCGANSLCKPARSPTGSEPSPPKAEAAGRCPPWPRPAELFRAAGAEHRRARQPGGAGASPRRARGCRRGEPGPPPPPPPGAMAALVLVLLAALGGRAVLPGARSAAPLAELRSQISGVESLLEEFRRQLKQEDPGPEAAGGGGGRCGGSGGFSARPDSIIRTKDSIAAGATFLRAPGGAAGWRQCLDACCAEPRCTLAVVQGPGRPRAAAELGCFLFNCTHRGRPVCRFAPHRGYSTYSRLAPQPPADADAASSRGAALVPSVLPLGKGRRAEGTRGARAGASPRWLRAGRAAPRARKWRRPPGGAGRGRGAAAGLGQLGRALREGTARLPAAARKVPPCAGFPCARFGIKPS